METAALEVRRHERHNVLCAVTVARDGLAHEGYILDLSVGGARVDLDGGWTPVRGTMLRMCFDVPDSEAITLDTQVAWFATNHIGLRFVPQQDDAISRLLDAAGAVH